LCRACFAEQFPEISAAKIKEGVFIGLQMHQLFRDEQFDRIPSGNEKRAWNSFGLVVTRFLGSNKADNYREHVENLLLSYQKLGCSMPLTMHFQHSRLEFYPENCGVLSDELGERFHYDISAVEKRYQGKWISSMLAVCCWTVTRDSLGLVYQRQVKRRRN
jgi:hypothetical protein